MKRLIFGFALSVGMLFVGVTNASAYICVDDPTTLGAGIPVKTNVSGSVTILSNSVQLGASTTNTSTTYSYSASLL